MSWDLVIFDLDSVANKCSILLYFSQNCATFLNAYFIVWTSAEWLCAHPGWRKVLLTRIVFPNHMLFRGMGQVWNVYSEVQLLSQWQSLSPLLLPLHFCLLACPLWVWGKIRLVNKQVSASEHPMEGRETPSPLLFTCWSLVCILPPPCCFCLKWSGAYFPIVTVHFKLK